MKRTREGRSPFLLAVLFAVVLGCPSLGAAQELSLPGHWEGEIAIPGVPLAVDIDFARDGAAFSGEISIPAQGARDLPLGKIVVLGGQVSFELPGVPGKPTFKGRIAADGARIAGDLGRQEQLGRLLVRFRTPRPREEAARDPSGTQVIQPDGVFTARKVQ